MAGKLYVLLIFTGLLLSCNKVDNPMERYIGNFDDNYIASLHIDKIDEDRSKEVIDSIVRKILIENGVDNKREITIYLLGNSTFYFIASFTLDEMKKIKDDNRIKELSKDIELTAG